VCEGRGLVAAIAEPDGALSGYEYGTCGNLIEVVQPNAGVWAFEYDTFGRRSAATDPAGTGMRYVY